MPYVALASLLAALKSPSVHVKSPLAGLKSLLDEVKRPLFMHSKAKAIDALHALAVGYSAVIASLVRSSVLQKRASNDP